MNILKERMKRIAVIGLVAAMITAQVPQGVYGTEAAAETVEVMQKDAPVVEETQKGVLVMEEAEVSGEEDRRGCKEEHTEARAFARLEGDRKDGSGKEI